MVDKRRSGEVSSAHARAKSSMVLARCAVEAEVERSKSKGRSRVRICDCECECYNFTFIDTNGFPRLPTYRVKKAGRRDRHRPHSSSSPSYLKVPNYLPPFPRPSGPPRSSHSPLHPETKKPAVPWCKYSGTLNGGTLRYIFVGSAGIAGTARVCSHVRGGAGLRAGRGPDSAAE